MLALTEMEIARNEFLNGLILTGIGFVLSGTILYFQLFRREAFLRFIDWDTRISGRLHFPPWWINGWRRFALSRAGLVYWIVLVALLFLLMCGNIVGYLVALHRLSHTPPPNKPATANPGWRTQICREPGWFLNISLSWVAEPRG